MIFKTFGVLSKRYFASIKKSDPSKISTAVGEEGYESCGVALSPTCSHLGDIPATLFPPQSFLLAAPVLTLLITPTGEGVGPHCLPSVPALS